MSEDERDPFGLDDGAVAAKETKEPEIPEMNDDDDDDVPLPTEGQDGSEFDPIPERNTQQTTPPSSSEQAGAESRRMSLAPSADRPFTGKLSAVEAIEAAEDLDDFEEQERQVKEELESSQERDASMFLAGSVQNRQDGVGEVAAQHSQHMMPSDHFSDEDEYDSDYPDGVEYPSEPPPAYSSPPPTGSGALPPRGDSDSEEDVDPEYHFSHAAAGVGGALLAGGMALAGMGRTRTEQQQPQTASLSKHSSQESLHYNDAIRSPPPSGRPKTGKLPPMSEAMIQRARVREPPLATGSETPQAVYPMTNELKALLAYTERYQAQTIRIETELIPFDVVYLPAVGDVNPCIGVPRPDDVPDFLGIKVLDEPAPKQSDSTVLNMLLRQGETTVDQPVKNLQRIGKNDRQIDQWLESVKEVHRSKPPDRVTYTRPMPDIEKLMEEWPMQVDALLAPKQLLSANMDASTEEFVDLCLAMTDIPNHKSRIQGLHVLFSLYNEFKNSQHFRAVDFDELAAETNRLEL